MSYIISGYGRTCDTSVALFDDEHRMLWSDSIESPGFVCDGGNYFFAVTETKTHAALHAYRKVGNGYTRTDKIPIDGGLLCHISFSPKTNLLFGACYWTGNIFLVPFNNGEFGKVRYIWQKRDAELTRAHCVLLRQDVTDADLELLTTNIALDMLYIYSVRDGHMVQKRGIQLKRGIGPRHIIFSSDYTRLYLVTEYSNQVLVFDTADYTLLQQISTLPAGFVGLSNCSTLCLSADGRYLYTANRFHDTITVFSVEENGCLVYRDEFPCHGKNPRHMVIHEDTLAICYLDSDAVSFVNLNPETGMEDEELDRINFGTPAGIFYFD
ncbi:MAG: lactonase family protein [Lachnospiraceae bacterium]|nr:lactonase family protein [Lachnospiraceae bacterium]